MALILTDEELLAVREKALSAAAPFFSGTIGHEKVIEAAKMFEAYLIRDAEEAKDAR